MRFIVLNSDVEDNGPIRLKIKEYYQQLKARNQGIQSSPGRNM